MDTNQHRTRIEDNGLRGEDAAWLPACTCGWVGDVTHRLRDAELDTQDHATWAGKLEQGKR